MLESKNGLSLLDPRFLEIKLSPTLRAHAKQSNSKKKIYKFGFGQSPFPVPNIMQNRLAEHKELKHYSPCTGEFVLQKAISKWFKREYSVDYLPENIVMSCGSKFLFYLFQMIFSGEIFLTSPCWVSYMPQSKILGKENHVIHSSKGKDSIFYFILLRFKFIG